MRPAGLAAAQQLARAGTRRDPVRKNDRVGGLLRYGIPDFKLDKAHIDRRVDQLVKEGVTIRTGVMIGRCPNPGAASTNLVQGNHHPSSCDGFRRGLAHRRCGVSRDLPAPDATLDGIHFAMEFLPQQNKVNAGDKLKGNCAPMASMSSSLAAATPAAIAWGTSNRHGAKSVTQFEVMPCRPSTKQTHGLAPLAAEAAHQLQPRRRLQARVCHLPRNSPARTAR